MAELPNHWLFAAGVAFHALEEQIRHFNFTLSAGHHTFAGVSPSLYIEIIDGFLAEDSDVLFGGDRRRLEVLRELIVTRLEPAFESGRCRAQDEWQHSEKLYGALSVEEIHTKASEVAPSHPQEREWFIEGFVQSWVDQECASLGFNEQ